MRHFIL